jgi:hypothetical protein
METTELTPNAYIESLPEDRKPVVQKLRETLLKNLPEGFAEHIGYGMLCYSVPHSLYPEGYHCNPKQPLPFISLGSNKSAISLHHIGLYADEGLLNWFTEAYKTASPRKLDMGKGCVRFKKMEDIPYDLIAELARKLTPQQWIGKYEKAFKKA